MGIVNRRNAIFGWLAWSIAKRVLKRKAKAAVPTIDAETRRPNRSLLLLTLAGAGAAAYFWFRQSGGPDAGSPG
jgi:hypothetical protein